MLPRPKMRSQIMHIPTGLYLSYCYYPGSSSKREIHLVLSKDPAPRRDNTELFEYVSDPSWDIYMIHSEDWVFDGTCDEFVLVEQRV